MISKPNLSQPTHSGFVPSISSMSYSGPIFPLPVQQRIIAALMEVYGIEETETIYPRIESCVKKIREERPDALLQQDIEREEDWFRTEVVYMFYTTQFGVSEVEKPNTFDDLILMLDYLKALGVSTLYILPFLKSPMIDAGFDVSDFRAVREELGGNDAFDRFMAAAKERGFKIKADLILNHVSDQHPWFQAAVKGDTQKLNYFIYRDTAPVYNLETSETEGEVAIYQEDDGQKSSRRLIFPDISDSHYRKQWILENGDLRQKHFYHTFYPHQLDLNWFNADVLLESIDIMGYWANKGIDIFRLDAIPFFTKKPGTSGENLPTTHAVVKILSACLQAMAPCTVIQAEACQWPKDIRPYFGEEEKFHLNIPDYGQKMLTRTDEVQIAYHFPWMPAIWASVITENAEPFWKATSETPMIPETASWAIFLRVHDELTLEMVDPVTRRLVYNALIGKGASFRAGLGVSGRLANFLDNNPTRIIQIFSILLSIPGIPIIYYGDEIAEQNNATFMLDAAREREQAADKDVEVKSFIDTRDLARAPITRERFTEVAKTPSSQDEASSVFHCLQRMIRLRKNQNALSRGTFTPVTANSPSVLSYIRTYTDCHTQDPDTPPVHSQCLVIHNLAESAVKVALRVNHMDSDEDISLRKPFCVKTGDFLDILTNQNVYTSLNEATGEIQLTLDPYQSVWLV